MDGGTKVRNKHQVSESRSLAQDKDSFLLLHITSYHMPYVIAKLFVA